MSVTAPAAEWEGRPAGEWAHALGLPAVYAFTEVGSTNDIARAHALAGAPAGLLVIAEHQHAGRGRMGRTWQARPGASLLFSFLLRPRSSTDAAPGTLPLRVGLAVARALRASTRVDVRVKWPNDLVTAADAKLAGVLCEAATGAGGEMFVVAGIGLNVRAQPWPAELQGRATSLDEVTGGTHDRGALLRGIIAELRPLARRPLAPLTDAELAEYEAVDALRGRAITVHDGSATTAATAIAIDADGALRILGPHGSARVTSATVRLADNSGTGIAP